MTERPSLRSQRLNQITHAPHAELDALVKSHAPFDSRESFARFSPTSTPKCQPPCQAP